MFAKQTWPGIKHFTKYAQQAHVAFFLLAALVSIFFALKVPIGYNTDESVQAFRTYYTGSGHISTYKVGSEKDFGQRVNLYGGKIPYNLIMLEQYTNAGIRHTALCTGLTCGKPTPTELQQAHQLSVAPIAPSNSYNIHFWGASYYFFIAYVPGAIGMDVARLLHTSVGHMVIAGRLSSALFYCLAVAWAIYLLRKSRVKWLVFSVALLPPALSQAASLGADMTLNASALVLFTLIVKAFEEKHLDWPLKTIAILAAIVLPLSKSPYIFLSFGLLLAPIFPSKKAGWWWGVGVLLAILIPTVVWGIATADMAKTQAVLTHAGKTNPNLGLQERYIATHPIQYAGLLVSSFFREDWLGGISLVTSQNVALPLPILLTSFGLISITALTAAPSLKKSFKRIPPAVYFGGIGLLGLVAVGSAIYISYNSVGISRLQGVQGRYLIPFIPFLVLGLAFIAPFKIALASTKTARLAFLGCNALLLFCLIWYYYSSVFVWAKAIR